MSVVAMLLNAMPCDGDTLDGILQLVCRPSPRQANEFIQPAPPGKTPSRALSLQTPLAVRARDSSALGSSNNDVQTLAAAVTAADQSFVFTNKDGFTVGTVDSLNGVSTNGGNITLRSLDTADDKDLILAQGVDTGVVAGDVTLQSVGGQVRTSAADGIVSAQGLSVRALSGVDLDKNNTVATLAAATTAGDIAFNNTAGFAIGTVGDLSGLAARACVAP
ncbi:MAG: hypothetical protein LRY72_17045 [Saccharospirillaceae bacterium]|nr:hypothetical protein [Saccharospirillaceae bacterium]